MPAKLIVIEGADASGKKTQAALLEQRLQDDGLRVATLSFPQYDETKVGGLLRECIDGKRGNWLSLDPHVVATVYATDRVEALPRLNAVRSDHDVIILDRYTTANLLHQGAKVSDTTQRSALMQWIRELEHDRLGIPAPDAVFVLSLPAELRQQLAESRAAQTGTPFDSTDRAEEHQRRVAEVAKELCTQYPHAHLITAAVDQQLRSPEDIHAEIYAHVRDIL